MLKFKLLSNLATIPTRGSEKAAGLDLYAATSESVMLFPGETKKIPTDIAMAIPDGYFGAIFARSGLATKNGVRPANCVGVIDSDYRGNVIVALHNDSDKAVIIQPKTRIAQLVIMAYFDDGFVVVENLDETTRGEGGFGSTGK